MANIVIIDKEPQSVLEMEEILKEHKEFKILASFDGWEVLDALDEWNPDLLIINIYMPGISGFEIARRIKAVRPVLPVFLMSEHTGYAVESFEIGISGFLIKPLDKYKVFKALNKLF